VTRQAQAPGDRPNPQPLHLAQTHDLDHFRSSQHAGIMPAISRGGSNSNRPDRVKIRPAATGPFRASGPTVPTDADGSKATPRGPGNGGDEQYAEQARSRAVLAPGPTATLLASTRSPV